MYEPVLRKKLKKFGDVAVSVHKEKYFFMCVIGGLVQLNIAITKSLNQLDTDFCTPPSSPSALWQVT